jgi:LEA14-like dessication related protein
MIHRSSLKSIWSILLLLVSFLFLAAACSQQTLRAPEVQSITVRLKGWDRTALFLEGKLEVFNPNDLSSRFSGYAFELELEGQRVLSGQSDQAFTVPAQEIFSVTIPVTILFKDLLALRRKELFNRELQYRFAGMVTLDSWFPGRSLPFSSEGTINLAEWLKGQVLDFLGGL